jgi:RNA polymerase primary sigma factor
LFVTHRLRALLFNTTKDKKIMHQPSETDSKSISTTPLHSLFGAVNHKKRCLAERCPAMVLSVMLSLLSATDALSAVSARQKLSFVSDMTQAAFPATSSFRQGTNYGAPLSWSEEFLVQDEDMKFEDEIEIFQDLQRSLGSEVVSTELHRQIEDGVLSPNLFLERYAEGATMLEKVAMSSLPQQLPKPAISALSKTEQAKKSNTKTRSSLNRSHARVAPNEEFELARKIQQGVTIHKVKTDFEAKHGREITKQEWADLAGLKSAKELRKLVSDYRACKQQLVESNMGLVHAVVKKLSSNTGKVSYEEMIQEGSLGLIRAAELFDPSRGLRFSTYATIWIKGMLSNSHVKETITLPAREKTKWNRIRQAHDELVQALGREPTRNEISQQAGLSVEEVATVSRRMTQAQQVMSLDYEYKTQSRSGLEESRGESTLQLDKAFMADVDLAERTQFHADVVAALAKNLDAREARLMRLRYGLADGQFRSIQECADAMGLSKTRAQQLAQSCLKKLREASEAESLQEYLLTIA